MILICVLVPCHDLLTHAAGSWLIMNHHLVLLRSGEGGMVCWRGKLSVICSCCQLGIFVCVQSNDVVFMFVLSCTSCPYARRLSVGSGNWEEWVYPVSGGTGTNTRPRDRNQHEVQESTQCVAGGVRLLVNLRAD